MTRFWSVKIRRSPNRKLRKVMASLRATACGICKQELEPAQEGLRCEVCRPDYEVCTACYSKGSFNHPHILISRRPSPTDDSLVPPNTQTNQILFAQLRGVLLHVMTCCTKECHYPRCRNVKLLIRHAVACKNRSVCNICKRMWVLFRMHASKCRDPQCTVSKCRELRAVFSRKQQQADSSRRRAVVVPQRASADAATSSTP